MDFLWTPPSSESVRRVEHLLCLAVALWGAREVVRMGPTGVMNSLFSLAQSVPGLSGVVAAEEAKALRSVEEDILGEGDARALVELPEEEMDSASVFAETERLAREMATAAPKGWGGIYYREDEDLKPLQARVWKLFSSTNALYPGIFPAVRKFEAELAAMSTAMLGGAERTGSCGLLTSGGTESILMAVKAYRDRVLSQGRRLAEGLEVVACATAHPALDKACEYFGLTLTKLPARSSDQRMDPESVRSSLSSRTIMVYASAPTFPHGVIDPIEDIAAVCREAGVGLHVDNCLGGILLSAMQLGGVEVPAFDFRVEGVESVSMDLHKYGQCSKGVSVVCFSSQELRRHAYCTVTDWPGGLYVTHTSQGSRSGAIMAVAWATLLRHGKRGYVSMALKVHTMVQALAEAIRATPGLRLLTQPDACIVSFTSDDFSIYQLVDRFKKDHGRTANALQRPAGAHICVSERMEADFDQLVKDLKATAAACLEEGSAAAAGGGTAGIYGSSATLPPAAIDSVLRKYPDIVLTVKKKEGGGE